jgi:hypothetical protein
MSTSNEQPQSRVPEAPVSDIEYEALRQEVVKEYDSPFYGGIGHVAVEPAQSVVYEPTGPWVGM